MTAPKPSAIGIDFGTTNSVVASTRADESTALVEFAAPAGPAEVFQPALCFWQDHALRGGLGHEAGPWAIAEFLDFPQGSRLPQSFKSLAPPVRKRQPVRQAAAVRGAGADIPEDETVRVTVDCDW